MSHTFDIRFARSAGLAAILQAPENSFRWKGGGLLHIDAEGVSIDVKRGLLSLFAKESVRRIAAADLTEVYREGEALRLEFSTPDAQRAVMPFWVRDRDTAAEIVRLLPTRRTVELDHAVQGGARRFRVDVRLLRLVLAALALCLLGAALLARHLAPASPAAPAISAAPIDAAASASPQPRAVPPAVVPRSPDLAASAAPSAPLSIPIDLPDALPFPVDAQTAISVLDEAGTSYVARADPNPTVATVDVGVSEGVVPIARGRSAYQAAGRRPAMNLYDGEQFAYPAFRPLIGAELASTRAWRNYRNGSRDRDFAGRLRSRASPYAY